MLSSGTQRTDRQNVYFSHAFSAFAQRSNQAHGPQSADQQAPAVTVVGGPALAGGAATGGPRLSSAGLRLPVEWQQRVATNALLNPSAPPVAAGPCEHVQALLRRGNAFYALSRPENAVACWRAAYGHARQVEYGALLRMMSQFLTEHPQQRLLVAMHQVRFAHQAGQLDAQKVRRLWRDIITLEPGMESVWAKVTSPAPQATAATSLLAPQSGEVAAPAPQAAAATSLLLPPLSEISVGSALVGSGSVHPEPAAAGSGIGAHCLAERLFFLASKGPYEAARAALQDCGEANVTGEEMGAVAARLVVESAPRAEMASLLGQMAVMWPHNTEVQLLAAGTELLVGQPSRAALALVSLHNQNSLSPLGRILLALTRLRAGDGLAALRTLHECGGHPAFSPVAALMVAALRELAGDTGASTFYALGRGGLQALGSSTWGGLATAGHLSGPGGAPLFSLQCLRMLSSPLFADGGAGPDAEPYYERLFKSCIAWWAALDQLQRGCFDQAEFALNFIQTNGLPLVGMQDEVAGQVFLVQQRRAQQTSPAAVPGPSS